MKKLLYILVGFVIVFFVSNWGRGHAHFGNERWGISKSEVLESLSSDRFIAKSGDFILSEYRFGPNNQNKIYALYVFTKGKNALHRGIYFSIPDKLDTVEYEKFIDGMSNGYGEPDSRNSKTVKWVTNETVVELKRMGGVYYADARNRGTSFEEEGKVLLMRSIEEFKELQSDP